MTDKPPEAASRFDLKRDLGVWSAAAIVVGTVIGSAIFIVPRDMIKNVGSPLMVFAVWIFGGMLSLFGALSYAELAAALPEAGGEYVYLREAYGPLWGFIYGWTQMWVAKSGSIATLATGFFIYLANFHPELEGVWMVVPLPLGEAGLPLQIRYGQLLAMVVIAVLALIQYFCSCGWRDYGLFCSPGRRVVGLRRLEQCQHGSFRGPKAAAQSAFGLNYRDAVGHWPLSSDQSGLLLRIAGQCGSLY